MFKNHQLDPKSAEHLRHDPVVEEWIASYQEDARTMLEDCRSCGWPHNPVTSCGLGNVFGRIKIGGRWAYIDSSNVDYMRNVFIKENASLGFHWRNDIYIKRVDNTVVISFITFYNGHPNRDRWTIPINEFASIVCAASGGETAEKYQAVMHLLAAVRAGGVSPDQKMEPK